MTILIGSTSKEIRERWQQILGSRHQLQGVSSVAELSASLERKNIELVLLHRAMVDLEYIATIKAAPVFVLADLPDDDEACALLRAGVIGYANTYMATARLAEAIRIVLAGKVWVGQKLMQKIISGTMSAVLRQKEPAQPAAHNLSEREWEVAMRVSKGQSNLTIAAEMDISERTVKAHITSIFKKTATESRLQLALHMKALLSSNPSITS